MSVPFTPFTEHGDAQVGWGITVGDRDAHRSDPSVIIPQIETFFCVPFPSFSVRRKQQLATRSVLTVSLVLKGFFGK